MVRPATVSAVAGCTPQITACSAVGVLLFMRIVSMRAARDQ